MKIEFLGSGGAITIPRPGCQCHVCNEAREKDVPYSRTGPGLFVHGPDVMIDTSEQSCQQVNRAGLQNIPHALYSHWHPDHTKGSRLWESMNLDWKNWPPDSYVTQIYLPQQVAADFGEWLGLSKQFDYWENTLRVVKVHAIPDGDHIVMNGVKVTPFRLHEEYVYAFLFEDGDTRVLIAPDELYGWVPPEFVKAVDLAIIPMGIPVINPLTGERIYADDHPVLRTEATYQQTLDIVQQLHAKRVILHHIEEPFGMTYDDFEDLGAKLRADGLNIAFAYDTLTVEV